jgi:hypothetical protein
MTDMLLRKWSHISVCVPALQVHCYPPTVWEDDREVDDDDEWDIDGYEDGGDPLLAEEVALAEQER